MRRLRQELPSTMLERFRDTRLPACRSNWSFRNGLIASRMPSRVNEGSRDGAGPRRKLSFATISHPSNNSPNASRIIRSVLQPHPEQDIPDLILRSGVFAASRRMAASPYVASILRDASLRDAPQDEVFAKNSRRRACFEAVSCLILNKTSPDLILRSGVFAASRRMDTSPCVAAILRDARESALLRMRPHIKRTRIKQRRYSPLAPAP